MKHPTKITFILIGLFVLSQIFGLIIFSQYLDFETKLPNQKSPLGNEIPVAETDGGLNYGFIITITVALLVGTAIALFLMRKEEVGWMKLWVGIALTANLGVALGAFLHPLIALSIALGLVLWRIWYPSVWIQNATEMILYGGFAVIFSFALNIWTMVLLLVLISIYDAWAVWKSKHMIKLAKMIDYNIFAGLWINYDGKKAILGGGDIAFSLLASCVILRAWGILPAIITMIVTTVALALLLLLARQGKFYPAMPFISAGVFIGYIISWGVTLI